MAHRTFRDDCVRQVFQGLLDTGPKTFFLLMAVRSFSAGDLSKSLITIPGAAGMTLSVALVPLLSRLRAPKNRVLAASRILSGLCYLVAALLPSLEAYVFWVFLAGLPASITYPLLTAIYHENYPRRIRGQLFAWAGMVNTASSIACHAAFGALLERNGGDYRLVLAAFGAASLLTAWSLWRMPSAPRPGGEGGDPSPAGGLLTALRWVWKDRLFGYMLLVWFIFGFGVWMVTPLKVLFLSEARWGLGYPASTVALVIGVIPEATRLIASPLAARLFDRHHFVGIRLAINILLLLSLIAFFWGRAFPWLCVSAVLEGLVLAAGNIAWALWVTHVAPPKHTAEYMAAHQFFTGARGMIAVFVGIRFASSFGLEPVAWAATGLVVVSILMMLPARRSRRWTRAEPAAADRS